MNIQEIKEKLKTTEYNFLKEDRHLGNNICLLTLGGSYAYGLATPTSDLDVRGVATHLPEDLFGTSNFEQYIDKPTDTTIYGLRKCFNLWLSSNPNTIELLGCKPEHYFYLNEIGQEILDNKHLFMSKKALGAFAGYAGAQLSRLENYVCREKLSQPQQEEHILNSVESMMRHMSENYQPFEEGGINLYIDKAVNEDMETEIFMDTNLKHYPLRDYKMLWEQMNTVVKTYKVLGHRNNKDELHINKHIMHLCRLYLMVIDLLEKQEIITYREKDRDYLLSIRNGYYMNEDGTIKPELYDQIKDWKMKVEELKKTTKLPEKPYYKDAEALLIKLNKKSLEMYKA